MALLRWLYSDGPLYGIFAVAFSEAIHGQIEIDLFGGVFEEVELLCAVYQFAEAHSDEANEHAAGVQSCEKLLSSLDYNLVEPGIGDAFLHGVGVEIGIADFYGDTSRQFFLFAQLKSNLFNHGDQTAVEVFYIGSILVESAFGADALLLPIRMYRCVIDSVGFLPDNYAILAQYMS